MVSAIGQLLGQGFCKSTAVNDKVPRRLMVQGLRPQTDPGLIPSHPATEQLAQPRPRASVTCSWCPVSEVACVCVCVCVLPYPSLSVSWEKDAQHDPRLSCTFGCQFEDRH